MKMVLPLIIIVIIRKNGTKKNDPTVIIMIKMNEMMIRNKKII